MRVVVVGATGNVGTSLVKKLVEDAKVNEIVGLSRRVPSWRLPKTTFCAADVSQSDLVPHFAGADAVIHLAWLFQPTHNPVVTWQTNVEGSIRVFDAAATAGVKTLVYASSVGAYSPAVDNQPVDESWPTNSLPSAAYGREKAYVERVLDSFEVRNPDVRIVRLRPAFIFKRESATEQKRLFLGPFVPGKLLEPGRLPILPIPRGLSFQAVFTDDVAEAYRLALHTKLSGAFNIAADPIIDAQILARLFKTQVREVPPRLVRAIVATAWHAHAVPADPKLFDLFMSLPLLNTKRAREELGWTPKLSGTDAVELLLKGISQGNGGTTPPLKK